MWLGERNVANESWLEQNASDSYMIEATVIKIWHKPSPSHEEEQKRIKWSCCPSQSQAADHLHVPLLPDPLGRIPCNDAVSVRVHLQS